MKRIKAINGYTIYQATTQRDADNHNCEVGEYNIYLSSDIRDFGLSCSYPEWDGVDSLAVAVAMCKGSSYAVAVELAEELSDSTIQDMDLVLEIERRLDAGESLESVRDSYNTWDQYFYDPSVVPYLDVELQDDPDSDRGGIDHLGETVRNFLCDLGHPVDLAGLNDALRKCGILPVGDRADDGIDLYEDEPCEIRVSHASYAVLRDPDDGQYITLGAPYKDGLDTQEKRNDWLLYTVAHHLAFSDCGGWEVDEIVIDGEAIEYVGWQPGMLYEFRSIATGRIVWSQSFPRWDH